MNTRLAKHLRNTCRMKATKTDVQICSGGFIIVHATKGWLGASPDGWVVDPSYVPSNGMLKIKFPYSMA